MNLHKRNHLVYFYSYFAVQLIFIYINIFLPVYFFNVLNVNRTELAVVQIFAYLVLFIKPVIAIYFDKKNIKRKIIIILSSIGTIVSFFFFIFSLNFLLIFGIFLGINFACTSILDVAIDKIIVEFSPDEKTRDRNALYPQLGGILGAIIPNMIFYLIFADLYSIPTWNLFFLIGVIITIPLIIIVFLLKPSIDTIKSAENITKNEVNMKLIGLMCIIVFLFYSERIYEYPMEPWILNKYGEQYFSLFILILIIIILLNAAGLILAGLISNKFNRIRILTISSLSYGILLIVAPFMDMITFFVLFGIMQIFSGFLLINIISLMIEFSKKRVIYFQVMSVFAILAMIIFIPLGTYLSSFMATEIIIVTAGIMKILIIFPILLMRNIYRKQNNLH